MARFYHYTTEESMNCIQHLETIQPSRNGKFGLGVYFSKLKPGCNSKTKLAENCFKSGWQARLKKGHLDCYIEVLVWNPKGFQKVKTGDERSVFIYRRELHLRDFTWRAGYVTSSGPPPSRMKRPDWANDVPLRNFSMNYSSISFDDCEQMTADESGYFSDSVLSPLGNYVTKQNSIGIQNRNFKTSSSILTPFNPSTLIQQDSRTRRQNGQAFTENQNQQQVNCCLIKENFNQEQGSSFRSLSYIHENDAKHLNSPHQQSVAQIMQQQSNNRQPDIMNHDGQQNTFLVKESFELQLQLQLLIQLQLQLQLQENMLKLNKQLKDWFSLFSS